MNKLYLNDLYKMTKFQYSMYYLKIMFNRIIKIATIFTKNKISKQMEQTIKTKAELISRVAINHDTYILKFKFVDKIIPFTIGKHFVFQQFLKTWQHPEGQEVSRKYTPISPCYQKEVMDVLVKVYRPNSHPSFPNGGKMTPYLQSLKIGDLVHVEGPRGRFNYTRGVIEIQQQKIPVKRLFFIAGGSGITPCYNVITQIVEDKQDNIQLVLLFANKTEEDIVLRKELEALKPRVKIYYMIDKPKEGWTGFTGYISQQILEKVGKIDDPDTLYCHSGPFLMNKAVREILGKNPQTKIFKF